MKHIRQTGLILAFCFAGEICARLAPGGLPASVMGMLLMLAALGFRLLKPEHIGNVSDYLSGVMAFFFLPAAAAILRNTDLILPVIGKLLVIGVMCTFITFFASYGTARLLRVLLDRKNK